jgi:LPS sulfotransferase NodH
MHSDYEAPKFTSVNLSPTYFVCTTQRSGSTLLCRLLADTQVAGMGPSRLGGFEHLIELVGDVAPARDWTELDLDAHLSEFLDRSQSPNGVRGFKLMWNQVEQVAQNRRAAGGSAEPHVLFTGIPPDTRYVWLSRRDSLRQAISLTRAIQTQCWAAESKREFPGRPSFDYLRIIRSERWLKAQNEGWRQFFGRPNGPRALEIAYEDLIEYPECEARRVLDHIGIEAPDGFSTRVPATQQRADGVSDEWVERTQRMRKSRKLLRQTLERERG